MSLINEALKRAKQAQQNAPPPPVLQLKAVDPTPAKGSPKSAGVLLPSVIALVAIAALIFVWHSLRTGSSPQVVEAKTPPPAMQALMRHEPAFAKAPDADPSPADATDGAKPAQTPPVAQSATGTDSNSTAVANAAVASAVTAEPQPALRLQAIFFNPKHASVLISGRTVFLGEKIGDLQLMRIGQTSVTLIGGGRTNLLELP